MVTLASDIDNVGAAQRAKAKAAGVAFAQQYDPTRFDGSPFGALEAGRESLRSDIYRTIAQDQAKAAGDAANAATAPVAEALRREAAEIGMEAISAIVMPIQDSVPATVQASKEQLAKAGKGTRDHAHQSTEQGHASLSAAHGQATAEIEGHKQRSTAAVTGKGRSLMASIEQLCESLKRQLDKQAVLGSNECARKVEVIKEQLAEAHTPEQAAELWPLLSGENGAFSIIDTLEVDAQAAGDGLDTICREGLAGLDVFVADQDGAVAAAVTEDIAQIRAATQRMTQHTSASSNALVARIRGISDMFLRDARRGIAGSREKGSALEGAVRQHATDRKAMLLASVNEAKAQATEVLTGMLAKIPEQVQSSGDSELEVKKAGLQDKANRLRKAMAVAGTEEGDIHVLFAECGYGEIEALEATYNAQFQERADDGMTPLRYDLADEMSGEELEAAMAFLRHDRHRAIELALDNANGCVDTEEDIARSLLKACSDEDIEYLNTAGKDTVEALCYALSDTDLDVVTTYLDTSLSRDERETRVVAIEIYEHSAGKWGTDEDEVNDRLAAANTPEKRRALRDAYNRYVDDRRLIRNLNGTLRDSRKARMQTGEDHLAEMIDSELSGYEKTTSQQLAKNQRNSTAIDASKLLEGGDEKTFEALEGKSYEESGTSYASQHKALENELKNADGDQKKLAARAKLEALEENRRQALDQQVQTVSGGDETSVQEVLQKRLRLATLVAHQNGAAKGISELGKSGEQLAEDIPDCDELLAGKCAWDPTLPKLSYLISMRKLKQGYAEPELMLMYALKGADNKVAIIKAALSNEGGPCTKDEVRSVREGFLRTWGKVLASDNEMDRNAHAISMAEKSGAKIWDYSDIQGPTGVLNDALSGAEWLDVRVLLCGKPTSPEERHYITTLKMSFQLEGGGDEMAGEAYDHLMSQRKRSLKAYETLREMGLEREKIEYLRDGYLSNHGKRADPEEFGYSRERVKAA